MPYFSPPFLFSVVTALFVLLVLWIGFIISSQLPCLILYASLSFHWLNQIFLIPKKNPKKRNKTKEKEKQNLAV